jgi:hypothetical protein
MRRPLLLALSLLLAAPVGAQESDLSAEIGRDGLRAVEARLSSLPTPTDGERFALGGVRFLGAVEAALQTRYRLNANPTLLQTLPVMRLPLPENPAPEPFDPAVFRTVFSDLSAGMDAANAALSAIPDGADFALDIRLGDLWFDIDADGVRSEAESLAAVVRMAELAPPAADNAAVPLPEIRFDAADAAWLSAYTHLLNGVANLVLAYDPTEPLGAVLQAREELAALGPVTPDLMIGMSQSDGLDTVDIVALIFDVLDQTPDAARTQAARDHFLAMVADNRRFWAAVATETDNEREWLPNASQTSALFGTPLPPGTGETWLAILTEVEAILTGELLIPHWRISGAMWDDSFVPDSGVDLGKFLVEPAPIDLIDWIHGKGALPYMRKGQVASWDSWNAFGDLLAGQPMLLTVLYLN